MVDTSEPLIHTDIYARLVKAARIMAGYERVTDAATAIREQTGVKLSDRTLYGIERGEHVPSIEQYMGILLAYRPPTGGTFFLPSFRRDVQEMLELTWKERGGVS